jgi:hypothetical protein
MARFLDQRRQTAQMTVRAVAQLLAVLCSSNRLSRVISTKWAPQHGRPFVTNQL